MQALNTDSRPKSNDSDNEVEVLGVDGKFQWPVRIFSFLAFCATLAVNYFVGLQTGSVSRKFQLYVTPPGLFFTIWAVIYSTLAIVNIYNLIVNVWSFKTHVFFFISNMLNLTWICVFGIGTNAAVYLCSLILILLVPAILLTWIELGKRKDEEFTIWIYITRNVFAFYLGWVIAATNLNFGMVAVYWWGMEPKSQMIMFWIMAPLCAILATLFNGIREGRRGLLSCFALWFSVIWAFTGAGITSNGCLNGTLSVC